MPPFDKASFSLKTNEISQPVKSVYGYHIIQALSPVHPSQTQSFAKVESQIQANMAQQKKQTAWSAWLAKLKKDYQGKVAFQSGYSRRRPRLRRLRRRRRRRRRQADVAGAEGGNFPPGAGGSAAGASSEGPAAEGGTFRRARALPPASSTARPSSSYSA